MLRQEHPDDIHHQGSRTTGYTVPYGATTRTPTTATGRSGSSQAIQGTPPPSTSLTLPHLTPPGNLRPRRILLHPLPQIQALHRLRARLRSRLHGNPRNAIPPGPRGHLTRLYLPQRKRQTHRHLPSQRRVPSQLLRLLVLREPQWLARTTGLADRMGRATGGVCVELSVYFGVRTELH